MSAERIIETLGKHRGVRKAVLLDQDAVDIIKDEECHVVSSFGTPFENEALTECFSKDIALCIYCDYSFERPDDSILFLKDGEGRIMGQDVAASKKSEFEGKSNIVWLSDDFIMYPEADMGPGMRMVMVSQVYRGFSNEDGVSEAVVFFPATSTDCILKSRYGDCHDPQIATAIMGISLR